MLEQIFLLLGVSLIIQIILFVPAFIYKTDKLTDLSYSISFFILAGFAFWQSTRETTHILLFVMITLWAIRLGTYLFIRIKKINRDKRFDGIRESFIRFLKFWIGQGIVVWLVMISSILYFNQTAEMNYLTWLGLVLWFIALVVETIADWQKYVFINNPGNKNQWIESGLWKYSRHPNYFGEILHWIAIYIFVISGMGVMDSLIALVSPIFIIIVIVFATGLPMLEKGADKKWGDNHSYLEYKKRTSILIPWFK